MNEYNFLENQDFLKARKECRFFQFTSIKLPSVSWDDVIQQIDKCTSQNLPIETTANFGMVIYTGNDISYINEVSKYIGALDTTVECSAHLYISFSSVSKTFGRHKDTSDVFFWQGIGCTKWIIEDVNEIKTITLNKGDMIYVPKQMYHNVIPVTPRVGISIGLDY